MILVKADFTKRKEAMFKAGAYRIIYRFPIAQRFAGVVGTDLLPLGVGIDQLNIG